MLQMQLLFFYQTETNYSAKAFSPDASALAETVRFMKSIYQEMRLLELEDAERFD
jgi:hypothetical protein